MFDTKIAVVLRNNLAGWQKLNVTAFLMTGIAGRHPEIIGEAYRDRAGNLYNPLSIQPIIVLSADEATMSTVHRRALERDIASSLFIEEMFATGHDAANRAVFAEFAPEDAKVVGIALRAEKKIVGGLAPRRLDALPAGILKPADVVNAGAPNDAENRFGHKISNPSGKVSQQRYPSYGASRHERFSLARCQCSPCHTRR